VARFLSISKFVPVFNLLNTTILDAGIRERWVVSFTPLADLLPGNFSLYPLGRRLGLPQSLSGFYREKKFLTPSRESNPGRTAHSLSLYWLSHNQTHEKFYLDLWSFVNWSFLWMNMDVNRNCYFGGKYDVILGYRRTDTTPHKVFFIYFVKNSQ
jgi:hypothetical protein